MSSNLLPESRISKGNLSLTIGALFAGIGGFELGLERAGFGPVIWQAESDPYARRVLAKHWPGVRVYEDVRQIDERAERPDVLCGGFPCQDISSAGTRVGIDGERSGLWAEYARVIRILRPRYVLVENSAALLVRGMGRVLGDLAACGYDAEWDCVPAAAVGTPHRRDRVWIVAYPNSGGCEVERLEEHGKVAGALRREPDGRGTRGQGTRARRIFHRRPSREWPAEPAVGRMAHGVPSRMDRLRTLGNAVVPQVAEFIGRCILAAESSPSLSKPEVQG